VFVVYDGVNKMEFKNLIWNIFFEGDKNFVFSHIDVDEELEDQRAMNDTLIMNNENLNEDIDELQELLDVYQKEEAAAEEADELEDFWNGLRPKTTWLYYARPYPDNDPNRIKVDPRIFYQEYDNTIPRVSSGSLDKRANDCLKYVINRITYTTDVKSGGEYWQFGYETFSRRKGDCEDGAILLANMMLRSGIPYWRIRLNAGLVQGGGHAYVTYLKEDDNQWYVFDWCYWPTESVDFKKKWKNAEKYFGIWGSWNQKYVFGDLPKEVSEVSMKNGRERSKK